MCAAGCSVTQCTLMTSSIGINTLDCSIVFFSPAVLKLACRYIIPRRHFHYFGFSGVATRQSHGSLFAIIFIYYSNPIPLTLPQSLIPFCLHQTSLVFPAEDVLILSSLTSLQTPSSSSLYLHLSLSLSVSVAH